MYLMVGLSTCILLINSSNAEKFWFLLFIYDTDECSYFLLPVI